MHLFGRPHAVARLPSQEPNSVGRQVRQIRPISLDEQVHSRILRSQTALSLRSAIVVVSSLPLSLVANS